ncbi:SRPBCC family protein [Paracoccus sp. R86501]|uniref:SRPBCC family protein n=1 Tax=Paracoccus sp. R86501 TaxID=3101711 RepID=UPI00366C1CCE
MKFSTRIDTDLPAEKLFEAIGDFDALERMLIGRGASVSRIDPSQEPGITMGWNVGFDWRGRRRDLRLAVTRFDRPEQVTMAGRSNALDLLVNATVVALSRVKSRLIFETEIKPRNMKARLMLQTAKLGKGQMDRRFQRRVEEFVNQMRGDHG